MQTYLGVSRLGLSSATLMLAMAFVGTTASAQLADLTRCFVDSATDVYGLRPLESSCRSGLRDEARLWVLSDSGVQHFVRLLGPTSETAPDGEFIHFRSHRWSSSGGVYCPSVDRHIVQEFHIDHRQINYTLLGNTVADWQKANTEYRERGRDSGLSFVEEQCTDGRYDLLSFDPADSRQEDVRNRALTAIGFILTLKSDE